jgi:VWFA-related protein
MRVRHLLQRLSIIVAAVCASAVSVSAQQSQPTPNPDVVRVTTSLVQTDVMVFDKQGNFIDGLPREQFVLRVDGKPRDISFFERVQAGTSNEEAQIAAARGATSAGTPVPLDRGRTIFFFLDDFHLSATSLHHVRKMLSQFVERNAGQNDRVAIVTGSGQLGFLQQLTDNKTVLRRAIERLTPRQRTTKDFEQPMMSEYQAQLINQNDREVAEYFVEALMNQGIPRPSAEEMVRSRARSMMEQAAQISFTSLQSLRLLTRTAANLPGRKLVFFISDGFLVNARDFVRQAVRDLTGQAARSGVVIYSMDARGLVSTVSDPSDTPQFDPSGRLNRSSGGESTAVQDGMHALAADTGGRALFNTNDLLDGVKSGLAETSKYYLLAWRPNSEEEKDNKARRLAVLINGRPDLVVRFRKSVGEPDESEKAKTPKPKVPPTDAEALRATLRAEHPKTSLPVHVSANFLNLADTGTLLVLSVKIETAKVPLETVNGNATSLIDLAVAIFDENGKSVKTFSKTLNLRSITASGGGPPDFVVYRETPTVAPGLYQVRVAAVERKERRAGSTHEWIEVPNLNSKSLAMSSLFVAEQTAGTLSLDVPTKNPGPGGNTSISTDVRLNIDRRFPQDSHLRFLTFVYNAATAAQGASETTPGIEPARAVMQPSPDLAIQVQVFRDDQPVVTAPARKIKTEGVDLARVPYGADVSLEGLQPGSYVLQATVIDRIAKTTAHQRFKFQVD